MTTVAPPDPVHTGPDVRVWAARHRTGIDFHAPAPYEDRTDCGRGMGSPGSIMLPLAEALGEGMRPCPRCWPLGLPTPATPAAAPPPVDPADPRHVFGQRRWIRRETLRAVERLVTNGLPVPIEIGMRHGPDILTIRLDHPDAVTAWCDQFDTATRVVSDCGVFNDGLIVWKLAGGCRWSVQISAYESDYLTPTTTPGGGSRPPLTAAGTKTTEETDV